ncbi:release factor glutamine methyltransferase [Bacillus sp. OV166]|nr:release factor glutamine methyltransferase [Bacillus sp. OV166]
MVSIVKQIKFYMDDQTEEIIIHKLRTSGSVFAEEEALLLISEAPTLDDLMKMVEMRTEGIPLEHVIGYTEFCGLRIKIDSEVFVPRKRTEFLVRQAETLTCLGDIVVDMCCGSGAVGAALAAILGRVALYSVDLDPAAVSCAGGNITAFGGHVFQGDLFTALPHSLQGRVNIVVANAPYVPTEAIKLLPREALLYEPKLALDGGKDGLDLQRMVAKEAPLWLAPGGHLLLETSEQQAYQTFEIFSSMGLIPKVARNDELDATVIIGTKPSL